MKKEYKDIFFLRLTHDPHPHKLGASGLFHKQSLRACGVASLRKKISLYSFLLMVFLFLPTKIFASVTSEVNKSNVLYKQGKFDDSIEGYQHALSRDQDSPVINYNLGTALYKKGSYDQAQGFLEKAAKDKNIRIKSRAEYNLGNDLYKLGIQKVDTDIDESIKSLEKALQYYKMAADDDPRNKDALVNKDFVYKQKEILKQLKKQKRKQGLGKGQSKNNNTSNQNNQNSQNADQQQGQQENQKQIVTQQQNKNQSKNYTEKQKADQKLLSQKDQTGKNGKKGKNAQEIAEEDQKEQDRKQAEDLLADYQENEEPKKLLNYMPRKIDDRPVIKDW